MDILAGYKKKKGAKREVVKEAAHKWKVGDVCSVARHAKISPKGRVTGPWIVYESFTILEAADDHVIGVDNMGGRRKLKLLNESFPHITVAKCFLPRPKRAKLGEDSTK